MPGASRLAAPPAVRPARRGDRRARRRPRRGRWSSSACPTNQTTIILAMDVSGSMCSTDIEPDPPRGRRGRRRRVRHRASGRDRRSGSWRSAASRRSSSRRRPTRSALVDAIRSLTTGRRTAIGSGILASIDAIAGGRPERRPRRSSRAGRAWRREPVLAGAYAPGHHRPADRRREQRRAPTRWTPRSRRSIAALRVYTIGFGSARGRRARPGAAGGSSSATSRRRGGFGRVRRVRRVRRRRLPPRHRRGHAPLRRRPDRRRVLPGRERERARGGLPRPADDD